jgi:hypothetical protein
VTKSSRITGTVGYDLYMKKAHTNGFFRALKTVKAVYISALLVYLVMVLGVESKSMVAAAI